MKKMSILLKKEIKDFVYSSKCCFLFLLIIVGEKIMIKCNNGEYNLFFHFFWVTCAILQFVYDSFKTDVREKGCLFLHNVRIPFSSYYLAKCYFCYAIMILMLLGEAKRIVEISNIIQILYLFFLSMVSVPVGYFMLILVKGNEAVAAISSTLIVGGIFLTLTKIPASFMAVLLGITINVLLYFAVYMSYKSVYFRKQI